jgi:hypothetical protein
MKDIDREIARLEAGDTWRDDDEVVELEVKRPLDHVIPVRLSSDKWEAIRREAALREASLHGGQAGQAPVGVGPTTLARIWILEKLRAVRAGRKSA